MPRGTRNSLVLGAVVGLFLLFAASSSAAVRFAAPGGTGAEPCASQATPCPLFLASGGAVKAGDEVVLAPGEYSDTAGDLGAQGRLTVAAGVHLHGAVDEAQPLIALRDQVAPKPVEVSQTGVLSRVRLFTETASGLVIVQGEAKGIVAIGRTLGGGGVVCDVRQGVLRDSACIGEGEFAAAAGARITASGPNLAASFVNVTALLRNGIGVGLGFRIQGDANYTATVRNAVAKGQGDSDILAEALSNPPNTPGTGADIQVNVDHSSYATVRTATDPGNGTAQITAPGTPTNIVAAPQTRADGFTQLGSSPTVDAGTAPAGGTVDVQGQNRTIYISTDIGADEYAHPTEMSAVCTPSPLEAGSAIASCEVRVDDLSMLEAIQRPVGTPAGTVRFEPIDEGIFNDGGVCVLGAVSADKATCEIDYTPTAVGSGIHRFNTFYSGGPTHETTTGTSSLLVNGVGVDPKDPGGGGGPGGTPGGPNGGAAGGAAGGSGAGMGPVLGVAPATALTKKPAKRTSKRIARFQFVSDQAGSSFECKLDKRPYKACSSPFKAKGLKRGRHTFMVRAKNSAGVPDSTPAVYRWRVR
ncbi:MAG TPA: hypothetical protein VF081_02240 [Solirubrobacterales bacterium]